jgi:hypothetical protein
MQSKDQVKNKIIILFILTLAAGFLFLLPQDNTKQKHLSEYNKTRDKAQDNAINCENNSNTDLSKILESDVQKVSPQSCLFVGCNGFTY